MSVYEKIDSLLDTLYVRYGYLNVTDSEEEKEYITYFRYDESSNIQVDDKEAATTYYFQFDVWSVGDPLPIANKLLKVLKDNGFIRRSAQSLREKSEGGTTYYRELMRFYYTEQNN
jgi:hypothetical protein